jgi:hypothetical protein
MKKIFLVLTTLLFVSCSDPYNVQVNKEYYRLVRKGYTDKDGNTFIPLYEKRGNTNSYYTPSLTGDYMVSIMK